MCTKGYLSTCLVCPLVQLVDVYFQDFSGYSVSMKPLSSAPAHFYVLCGLLLKFPSEPRSKSTVAATAPRVAVLSVPQRVVGVPPLRRRWVASGRLAVIVPSYKWWWTGTASLHLGQQRMDSYNHFVLSQCTLLHMSKYGYVLSEAHAWLTVQPHRHCWW